MVVDTTGSDVTERFRVVPASYVFLLRPARGGDEVLLQLRQNTGYMDDHWAAAEAREETGVDLGDLTFLTSMQRTAHADPIDERIDFFFSCRAWSGEPRIVEPAKCAALDWFPLDRLPEPVVPHERYVLERLGTGVERYTTFGF